MGRRPRPYPSHYLIISPASIMTPLWGGASLLKCAYEVFGADHLIFATDAPFGPGSGEFRLAEYPKVIESLGLSEEDERKILADNARQMLNLD